MPARRSFTICSWRPLISGMRWWQVSVVRPGMHGPANPHGSSPSSIVWWIRRSSKSCLRPGVPGLSERIRVLSIIDRYLEHARIFYFHNAGEPEYLLASADWMPRNLDRRVEIAFPVLDPKLQAQLHEILDIQLADTAKARVILPDGSSRRIQSEGAVLLRSQERLYEFTSRGVVR